MEQMGLVAVDLVAGTFQEVVGAKKKYLCIFHNILSDCHFSDVDRYR